MLQHLNRTVLNRRNEDGDDCEGTARILQVEVVAGRGEKCHTVLKSAYGRLFLGSVSHEKDANVILTVNLHIVLS